LIAITTHERPKVYRGKNPKHDKRGFFFSLLPLKIIMAVYCPTGHGETSTP
jgi:hypothetical protein